MSTSNKKERLLALPLLSRIRESDCSLSLSDERSVKVSLYSALAHIYLFRCQPRNCSKPIAIFGCSCKSRLKVVNSFINSRPVDGFPLVAKLTTCKTRTVRYLWISYISTNQSLLLRHTCDKSARFHVRTQIPILRITHRHLLFITSSAVCVIAWSCDLATQREHMRFTKFQIGDNCWDLRSHL